MNKFLPLENMDSVVAILSQISLFGGVTEAQQQKIFQRLEKGICGQGQYVFQKGDEPSHIYIITSGCIELFIPDREVKIEKKKLHVGECFGQVALMSIHQHTVSAVALADSEFIVLSKHALLQLHHEDVTLFALLMMNIARELARRLQFMDHLLVESIHVHQPNDALATISGP